VVFSLWYAYPLGYGEAYVKISYGVCKSEKEIFPQKLRIIRARFRVNHRRPGRKDIRLTGQNHICNP
jgi:hypothetical protein